MARFSRWYPPGASVLTALVPSWDGGHTARGPSPMPSTRTGDLTVTRSLSQKQERNVERDPRFRWGWGNTI